LPKCHKRLSTRRHPSAGGPISSSFIGAAASLKGLGASHRSRRGDLGSSLCSSFCWHGLFLFGESNGFLPHGQLAHAHLGPEAASCRFGAVYQRLTRPCRRLKQLETSCFSLLSRCAKTVSESHLLRVPGLLSSEEQIPQIVVNVRSWRETMETLEEMTLLHTQEVTGSSPVAPTIQNKALIGFGVLVYALRIRCE